MQRQLFFAKQSAIQIRHNGRQNDLRGFGRRRQRHLCGKPSFYVLFALLLWRDGVKASVKVWSYGHNIWVFAGRFWRTVTNEKRRQSKGLHSVWSHVIREILRRQILAWGVHQSIEIYFMDRKRRLAVNQKFERRLSVRVRFELWIFNVCIRTIFFFFFCRPRITSRTFFFCTKISYFWRNRLLCVYFFFFSIAFHERFRLGFCQSFDCKRRVDDTTTDVSPVNLLIFFFILYLKKLKSNRHYEADIHSGSNFQISPGS